MFPLALLTFVSSSLLCGAQTATIDVADQSKVDCLARLAGEIELSESDVGGVHQTSYVDHITTTNLSKKPIMAMVIVSQISNSYGPMVQQYSELDAFFSHKLEIAPSQKYTHQHEDNGTFSMPVPQDAAKISLAASSQVVFVQFSDGSTCGNRDDYHVVDLWTLGQICSKLSKNLTPPRPKVTANFLRL